MNEATTSTGLDVLRERMERRSRTVPTPRRPLTQKPALAQPDGTTQSDEEVLPDTPVAAADTKPDESMAHKPEEAPPVSTVPIHSPPPSDADEVDSGTLSRLSTEPTVNLAGRVRSSLGLRLDQIVLDLRLHGVRASKAELLEMLLFELPEQATPELRDRLERFRNAVRQR